MHALDEAWQTIKREFDAACSQVARAARCQLTNELNQLLRRFRNYHTESEWISAVVDGGSRFARQIALFSVNNGVVTLRAEAKLNLPERLSFPLQSAPAFASAVETKDLVVALRAAGEVTEALSSPDPAERAHLIPIVNDGRVAAVLFAADQEYMDVNALELITGIASAVLERRSNSAVHTQIRPAHEARNQEPARAISEYPKIEDTDAAQSNGNGTAAHDKRSLPSWADLSADDRSLHIRAQRFSRVTVAEMQLSRPEACRAGREQSNLYLFLKNEIDQAREKYRTQFMTIPSMVDYLHLELVGAAAEGDERKLGEDYPGQLV